jgi:hypothetical protein
VAAVWSGGTAPGLPRTPSSGRNKKHREIAEKLAASEKEVAALKADLGRAVVREVKLKEELAADHATMLNMQRAYANLHHTPRGRLVDVPQQRPGVAYVEHPKFHSTAAGAWGIGRVELKTLVVEYRIGLREDCPPEHVARQMADRVERLILAEWRNQSALLKEK